MPTLFEIADAKLSLSLSSAKMALRSDSQAILLKCASEGMLRSGNAIHAVNERCLAAIRTIGDATISELSWVADKTFLATPTTIDHCNAMAHKYLNAIREECMTVLRETVPKCNGGEPQLQGTALKQHAQEQQCRMALSLALDSKYAEFKVQRVRAMFGSIQKLVSAVLKLLGLIH